MGVYNMLGEEGEGGEGRRADRSLHIKYIPVNVCTSNAESNLSGADRKGFHSLMLLSWPPVMQ